jgi:hypothetical protein
MTPSRRAHRQRPAVRIRGDPHARGVNGLCGELRAATARSTDGANAGLTVNRVMARLSFRRLLGPKSALPGPLYLCAVCGGDFVIPVAWSLGVDGAPRVTLTCGACGYVRDVEVTPTGAALLEAAREYRLAETAARLERERMSAWVESFTAALARDLIDASDF